MRTGSSKNRRGHAVMEFAFFLPYLLFTFVGAFDWGFYSWALIKTQDAARAAALYTSSGTSTATDSSGACTRVLAEMSDAFNLAGQSTCTGALTVTAALVTGPDGNNASQVTVSYQTPYLIPIPGLLPGQTTITRVVTMMVGS
jgi:Flp pilus assembly protein TadG